MAIMKKTFFESFSLTFISAIVMTSLSFSSPLENKPSKVDTELAMENSKRSTEKYYISDLLSTRKPEIKDIIDMKTKVPPEKRKNSVIISPPPDPDVILQGGDDCASATTITSLPFIDVGTTVGYTDDYDEECPYDAYNTPDVVYSFSPDHDGFIDITLCNDLTDYDTKIYVYEDQCTHPYYACNEDACSTESFPDPYVSEILYLEVFPGHTYYIVIDGYGGEAGTYDLSVDWVTFEEIECPPEGIPEGEPDCHDDYDDQYNSGCGGEPIVFSYINPGDIICGTSGTFLLDGANMRETDWYEYTTSNAEELIWKAVAEFPFLILILYGTGGCDSMEILAYETANQYDTAEVSTMVEPGVYWMWIGPSVFEGYPCPVEYVAWFNTGCNYIPGDINGDGDVMGNDVTYGVRYFKGLGSQPPDSCWNDSTSSWLYSGSDTNGNCQFTGSDITFLVAYFKGYNPEVLWCPQTPPTNPILNIGKNSSR